MTKKRGLNKMVRGILAWMAVMLMSMQMGTMAETVDSEAVFTKNGVSCDAFWPGNTIAATAQVVGDGSFDKAWVLLALKSNAGTLVKQISVTPVEIKNGINVVKGSIEIPSETDGDILEAYCLKEGKLGALTLKSTISKGTGAEPVQRYTAVDPEAWGFETNSLGGEDDGKDWSTYEVIRRSDTTYCAIANTIGFTKGTASIVSTADAAEKANVKEGAFAAKLVGNANTMTGGTVTGMSFTGIGRSYTQLSENIGKHRTIEGYMKIASLASDAKVRIVMRADSLKVHTRDIQGADIYLAGDNLVGIPSGEWVRIQLTWPNVENNPDTKKPASYIGLGLELIGEGTVYFDGFRLLEDTNLVTNGSFSVGAYNGRSTNRIVYGWSAEHEGETVSNSYLYQFKYDPTYACAAHHAGRAGLTGTLYQKANAFNKMVPGQTYEISVAYCGTSIPVAVIGDTTVTLTDSGKTTVRGTGDAAKTFKIYTGEYHLPDTASIPTIYKVASTVNVTVPEYFADFSIYPR